jgi:polysaccharide biosynthesis protein PslE
MTPPAMSFTLRDLAAPLFRRQRVLTVSFLLVFAAVALLGLSRWHKYEAHMAILVGRERLDPAVSGETRVVPQDVDAEVDLLRSRDLLQQVVLANDLQSGHHFWLNLLHPGQPQVERVERAVLDLASQIKLETAAGSNLIQVSYNSADPALAYGVLDSLSKIFLEKHARAQNDKAAMEDAEAGLRVLAQELIVPAPAPAPVPNRPSNVTPSISPVRQNPQVAAQQLLKKLAINLLDTETKRTQLLLKYETSHPLVKQANQQIAAIKEAIAESNRAKDEADLADQRDTLVADQRSIERLKAQASKARSQALDDAALQREAQADERNYLQYLAQREQARVGNAHGKLRISQVTVAIPPARPVLPAHGPIFVLFIALASAVLVSFPAAYLLDYFDPSFHTPAQVTEILRVPIVVAVPKRTA